MKGDKGDQGFHGAQGDQGIQGVKGDQGLQGAKGDQGDQGLCGADESSAGGPTTARCAAINTDELDTGNLTADNATITGNLDATSITVGSLEFKDGDGAVTVNESGSSFTTGDTSISTTAEAAEIKMGANEIVVDHDGAKVSGVSASLQDSTGLQSVRVTANLSSLESSQEARVIVRTADGNISGLVVESDSTTLSGGNGNQTTIRIDDDGVTLQRVENAPAAYSSNLMAPAQPVGAPVQIHNVANGTSALDAVNKSQLDAMYAASAEKIENTRNEAFRGVAISSAMQVFLPDPGKRFRVNFGMGYYKEASALGVTGSGRVTEDIGLYFGVGGDTSFEDVGGKAGVSLQW